MTEWKKILTHPGYEVSNTGIVRSFKKTTPIIIKTHTENGYKRVSLWNNNRVKNIYVHKLVLTVFKGEKPDDKECVAHGDGNRMNNHIENLRWATRSENYQDSVIHGTNSKGEKHGHSTITVEMAKKIKLMLSQKYRIIAISKITGVNYQTIQGIKYKHSWKWLEVA